MKMLPTGTKVKIITGLDDGCHFFEKGSIAQATEKRDMLGRQLFSGQIELWGHVCEVEQMLDPEDYIVMEENKDE